MESSQTLLRLGHFCARRHYRRVSCGLSLSLRRTTPTSSRHLLPVLLLPLPPILHLWNLRLLLDSQMANFPVERRMGLPRKILAVPRRILQHHSRTIRQGRGHQRTIRTDDARPTTTQLTHQSSDGPSLFFILAQGTLTDPVVLGDHLVFDSNSSVFLYPSNTECIVTVSNEETDYGILCFLRTDENESYSHVECPVHFSVGDSSILLNDTEYSGCRRELVDISSEFCLSDDPIEFCNPSACYVREPVNLKFSCRL